MFGSQILEIVIGLVFVYLLLSLLATTVSELVLQYFVSRGEHLQMVIKTMLNDENSQALGEKFFGHATIRKFYNTPDGVKPSYLSSRSFSRSLVEVLTDEADSGIAFGKLEETVSALPVGETRIALQSLLKNANQNVHQFHTDVENWYNETMDRATGWYKRKVQFALVIIGLCISILVNADTFEIASTLANDPEARKHIVEMAVAYVENAEEQGNNESTTPASGDSLENTRQKIEALNAKIDKLVNEQIASTSTVLGMGWSAENCMPGGLSWLQKAWWVLLKILGWGITALAISLGSTFWFDILKKLINIRNAGKRPESNSANTEAVG